MRPLPGTLQSHPACVASSRALRGAAWPGPLVALVIASLLASVNAHAAPPNIVLIVADDLGWNDVGYHGSEIATPHIDRIAREGIELDRFYVFPTCSPTRAALMTAHSPVSMGLHTPISAVTDGGLPKDVATLPERLKGAGYATALIGKWHLGHSRTELWPTNRGFDHFYGNLTGGIGYWNKVHTGRYDWQRDGRSERAEQYSTELIGSEAVRVIEARDRERPLFLMAAFNAPHLPNQAPGRYVDRHAHISNTERRWHAAMVAALDDQIGALLAAIEREGMAGETVVWFLSDNGGISLETVPDEIRSFVDWVEERGIESPTLEARFAAFQGGGASNAPLRGGKVTPWEGGIRVPAAVWWPGRTEAGQHDGLVSVQDVMPTLFAAAGITLAPDADRVGEDRWNAMLGGAAAPHGDVVMQSALDRLLLRPPWKLVLSRTLPWRSAEAHLYRPWDDPREERNLAVQHPEVVEELREALDAFPTGPALTSPISIVLHMDEFGDDEVYEEPWAELVSGGRFQEVYGRPPWPWLVVSILVLALALRAVTERWRSARSRSDQ